MRSLHLVVLFTVCVSVPVTAAASPSTSLPFSLTPQGAIIVPVSINRSEPVSFLLDTGSNGSVISNQFAAALDVHAVAKTTLMSASGQKAALVVRIEHLSLGTIDTSDVQATIAPAADLNLPDTAAIGCTVQGVIGQDVLSRLRYTIDYKARRIYWREPSAAVPPRAIRFELEPREDRFLVRLPQERRELLLVPDTGSEALVLFQRGESNEDCARSDAVVRMTGLGGTRTARRTVVRELRVGDARLLDVPAVIVHRDASGAAVDGLLPLHLFARVTFDGPERRLFIER
jgi:predicted aspartyl protease